MKDENSTDISPDRKINFKMSFKDLAFYATTLLAVFGSIAYFNAGQKANNIAIEELRTKVSQQAGPCVPSFEQVQTIKAEFARNNVISTLTEDYDCQELRAHIAKVRQVMIYKSCDK